MPLTEFAGVRRAGVGALLALAALLVAPACGAEEIRLEGVIDKDPTFEGGDCAILETDLGEIYELSGGDRSALVDRRYVVVRGIVPEDVGSACQRGTIFEVHEVECSSTLPPFLPTPGAEQTVCGRARR